MLNRNGISLLLIAVLVVVIVLVLIGIYMSLVTERQCREECLRKGASTYLRTQNGYYDFNDYCVCFYKNNMESFQL